MELKRWDSFSATNASWIEAKLAYIRLHTQTAYSPALNAEWGMEIRFDRCECLVNGVS